MATFFFLLLFLALGPSSLDAQVDSELIDPRDTDPSIDESTERHFVAIDPSNRSQEKLFLFFPGTDGFPGVYRTLSTHAADLGFHSIGLNYPNDRAVNILCALAINMECYERVRLEILDGTDRTIAVEVERRNSIENRLVKLLQYLETNRSGEGWDRYLDPQGEIKWEEIVVAGHSQGGGHAAIIASQHVVERVVMFASLDYNNLRSVPAPWIDDDNPTAKENYFALGQLGDEIVQPNRLQEVWTAYGLDDLGPLVNIDSVQTDFHGSHRLVTDGPFRDNILTPTPKHNSIAVDLNIPLLDDGSSALKDVWSYMMLGRPVDVSTSFDNVRVAWTLDPNYPNPFSDQTIFRISHSEGKESVVRIIDQHGKLVKEMRAQGDEAIVWDSADSAAGLYFIQVVLDGNTQTRTITKAF